MDTAPSGPTDSSVSQQQQAEDTLLSGANQWMVRGAGVLLLLFWVALAGVDVFVLGPILLQGALTRSGAVIVAVLALVTVFSLQVGYRLAFLRPNAYGSLLTPVGWSVLAGLFAVAGVGFTVFAVSSRQYESFFLPCVCAGFGYQCW